MQILLLNGTKNFGLKTKKNKLQIQLFKTILKTKCVYHSSQKQRLAQFKKKTNENFGFFYSFKTKLFLLFFTTHIYLFFSKSKIPDKFLLKIYLGFWIQINFGNKIIWDFGFLDKFMLKIYLFFLGFWIVKKDR